MEEPAWHMHTNYTNHAGAIFHKVKRDINPQLLTQVMTIFINLF